MSKYLLNLRTNQPILLTELIASSGEGEVWATENPKMLAKVYHSPTFQRQEKLRVMMKHPPRDPNQHLNCISFAWPQSLLIDLHSHSIVGFLMPAIRGAKELIEIYNPSRRRKNGLQVDWYFLHTAAHNVASIIHSIHEAGYVLGDIKPQNILINNQAIPSIIDTDSFQVKNPLDGEIYRCLVGSEGFTPPELLGLDFAHLDQSFYHDYFRIGVMIYFLLFGTHPFQGRWIGQGDSPELTELIRQGYWVFAPQGLIRPSRLTISLATLHPELQECFINCFSKGHQNPQLRPTSFQWQMALKLAIKSLVNCAQVQRHYYHQESNSCYWCQRAEQLQTDIFSGQMVKLNPQPSASGVPSHSFASSSSGVFANTSYGKVQRQIAFRPVLARQPLGQRGLMFLSYAFLFGSIIIVAFLSFELPTLSPPTAILKTNPSADLPIARSAAFYNEEGYQYYLKGNLVKAIAKFDQAIKMNPKLAEAYYNRSLAKRSLGDKDEAQEDWTEAIFLDPKLVEREDRDNPILASSETSLNESIKTDFKILPNEKKENDGNKIDLNAAHQTLEKFPPDKVAQKSLTSKLYSAKIAVKPSTKKPINPQSLIKEIESYGSQKQLEEALDSSQISRESSLNINLALSFYQQGLIYQNLGMLYEAAENFKQSSVVLKQEGNERLAKKVDTVIGQLKAGK
ncbi:MAG: protein kinase domain-containing protein [Microcystaceae cyanobacterium]